MDKHNDNTDIHAVPKPIKILSFPITEMLTLLLIMIVFVN